MNENDPYYEKYQEAIWYVKGRNFEPSSFRVTEEVFARQYIDAIKAQGPIEMKEYFNFYLKELDCFRDIMAHS